eukprot:360685-Chlamydomonas_euryale.AAC.10
MRDTTIALSHSECAQFKLRRSCTRRKHAQNTPKIGLQLKIRESQLQRANTQAHFKWPGRKTTTSAGMRHTGQPATTRLQHWAHPQPNCRTATDASGISQPMHNGLLTPTP